MKNSSQLSCSVALITVLLSAAANVQAECTPAQKIKTVVPGVLTVAMPNFPPFVVPHQDGSASGVEGDILTEVAKRECLKLDVKITDFSAAIQYVVSNKADLSSAQWYRTVKRSQTVGMSAPLYLDEFAIISKQGYSKLDQLKGLKIGTVQGYNEVGDLKKIFGEKLSLYPTPVALAQDLASGRLDVGMDSYAVGAYAQKNGMYKDFQFKVVEYDDRMKSTASPAQVGFVWAKDNEQLAKSVDKVILDLHDEKFITKTLENYGGNPASAEVGEPRWVE
ncbi:substrate-binding periplasmic protein [Pseudomonas sp. H11T01]|uniref:substrate-binding periplasmic protein n=1 Tax=Pseudomonas sp. H11T01 TaxID=3402749 RepID=UPI003ACCAC38